MIQVKNMENAKGNTVKNQSIINDGKRLIFQSYDAIIAIKKEGKITLDKNYWDYSVTTGRFRNIFLREGIAETRKKIKSGIYKLKNLNKEKQ